MKVLVVLLCVVAIGYCLLDGTPQDGKARSPRHRMQIDHKNDKETSKQSLCPTFGSCLACLDDPDCGWCGDIARCVSGTERGPLVGNCTNYQYHTCPTTSSSSSTSGPYTTGRYTTGPYTTGRYTTGQYTTGRYTTGPYTTGRYTTGPVTTSGVSTTGGNGVIFSQVFYNGQAPQSWVCGSWNDFRTKLQGGTFSTITIFGSLDPIGVTCSGSVASQLITALAQGNVWTGICNGRTWNVDHCGNGIDFDSIPIGNAACTCGSSNVYDVSPCIGSSSNWGGINGTNCGAATQTIAVAVYP